MALDNQFVGRTLLVNGIGIVGDDPGHGALHQPGKLEIEGKKVLGLQGAAIPSNLTTEQRLDMVISRLVEHGLIASE